MNIPFDINIIVNISIVVFYLVMVYRGVKTGFLAQLASMLGVIVSVIIAAYVSPVLAEYIDLWPYTWSFTSNDLLNKLFYFKINEFAWFFLIVVTLSILFALIKPAIKAVQKVPVIKQISGLFGGVVSIIVSTIWVLLVCLLLTTPIIANGANIINNTILKDIKYYSEQVAGNLLIPLNETQIMTNVLNGFDELNDSDKTWLRKWLDDNNFKDLPIEDFIQKNGTN